MQCKYIYTGEKRIEYAPSREKTLKLISDPYKSILFKNIFSRHNALAAGLAVYVLYVVFYCLFSFQAVISTVMPYSKPEGGCKVELQGVDCKKKPAFFV